ncbi:kinase-like domain-containing protein [Circinella umbellata]|nr:kinase-like domain-containing protein [Circinella umbellata]
MQHVNGVPVYNDDPANYYEGLDEEPTWFSAQGGVYKCKTRQAPYTRVAIKKYLVEDSEIYPDLFVMPKELVENEIYTMTKCNHPNILKLQGVYLHDEFVYLIMPYCTGGSLQQYVFEHHLTIGQLVHIITSIAAGLAEVHGHGYIHRDIKCDNIFLVEKSNEIVIGDFGVVSITPAADSNVEEAGVVLFWSPELVQRKIVNRKIDVWALGIVILEILNGGKAPYEDEKLNEDEIKQRILDNGKPVYPSNLPSRLVSLLDQCLNPDPRERAAASDILQHPFLCDYEPEPLFPANRIEPMSEEEEVEGEEIRPGEQYSEKMAVDNEDENMEDDTAMITAIQKLRALETLHDIDIGISDITNDTKQMKESSLSTTPHVTTQPSEMMTGDTNMNDTSPPSKTPSLQPDSPEAEEDVSTTVQSQKSTTLTKTDSISKKNYRQQQKQQQPISDIRRCRLPLRSFTLSKEDAATASAQEKVLNVLRKRQSISDAHWSQGSRLPMFKAMTLPPPSKAISTEKKLRRAKSVRLPKDSISSRLSPSSETENTKSVRKPMIRSNTVPSSQSSTLLLHKKTTTSSENKKQLPKKSNKNKTHHEIKSPSSSTGSFSSAKSPTSPTPSSKKRLPTRPKVLLTYGGRTAEHEEPPKKRLSMFRRKCPPGETRTARLMMGISTTGRRHTSSAREPQEPQEPTNEDKNGRRPGRLLRFAYKHHPQEQENTHPGKKRPVSVGSSKIQSESKKLQPESSQTDIRTSSRRQSVPSGFTGRKSASTDKQIVPTKNNQSTTALGAKVVRVH